MIKIWVQTRKKDKLTRSIIHETEYISAENFDNCLRDICNSMDIPTPIALSSHKRNFDKFNITKFVRSDFIESIDFDTMTMELVKDEKKNADKDDRNRPLTFEEIQKYV